MLSHFRELMKDIVQQCQYLVTFFHFYANSGQGTGWVYISLKRLQFFNTFINNIGLAVQMNPLKIPCLFVSAVLFAPCLGPQ